MNKCSPVEMRKNLTVVNSFKENGIDFVAIPVKDSAHKDELVTQFKAVMDELLTEAMQNEQM